MNDGLETGTELECIVAGVISTFPPFTNQHPSSVLPIAKAVVAAIALLPPSEEEIAAATEWLHEALLRDWALHIGDMNWDQLDGNCRAVATEMLVASRAVLVRPPEETP